MFQIDALDLRQIIVFFIIFEVRMRRVCNPFLIVSVIFLGFFGCFRSAAQITSTYTPIAGQREVNAIAVVQKSLVALGGVNAIASVQSIESSGTILKTGSSVPISFQWEEVVSGNHFEFRRETTANGKTRVFASGHGNPGFGVAGSQAMPVGAQMSLAAVPFDLPAIVLYAEFEDPTYSFISVNSSDTNGLIHIQIVNNSDSVIKAITEQDWYFDPKTTLPTRVDYHLPSAKNALDFVPASCIYQGYTAEQGVQYPTSIEAHEHGRAVSQVTIASIQPNASIPSANFDLPLESLKSQGTNR